MNGLGFIFIYVLALAGAAVYFLLIFKRLNRVTSAVWSFFIRFFREKWTPLGLLLAVIALAALGQFYLLNHNYWHQINFTYIGDAGGLVYPDLEPGIWFLILGGAVFLTYTMVYGYFAQLEEPALEPTKFLVPSFFVRGLLASSAALAAAANLFLLQAHGQQQSYWGLFALWIASILLFLLAFWPRPQFNLPSLNLREHWKKWLPLALILLTGFIARFYQLGLIPNIMENDEGDTGVQAVKVISGLLTNMFRTWRANGTLDFFMLALPVKLFGQTLFAIRLDTALSGFLALPVIYILAYKMFDHKIALVSTALLAVSHFDIHFSRVSAAASSLDPLLGTLSFLLIYHGMQSRRAFEWILAGALMGVGLYFYVGARVLIFIVMGFLILVAIFNWKLLWENRLNIIGLAVAYLVTAAPMLLWAITHPDEFNARLNQMGIFQNGWLAAEVVRQGLPAWKILLEQFVNSLLIFNYFNVNAFYNATAPALGPLTGAAFVCGLLAALLHLRDVRFALLSSWFWVTLIIGQVLVVTPWASAYRTLGIMPSICIMAAVALVFLAERLFSRWQKISKVAVLVLISLVLVLEGSWNIWKYFGDWAPQYRYSDTNTQLASLIGDYLGQQPAGSKAYVADTADFHASAWKSLDYQRKSTPFEDVKKPMDAALSDIKLASRTIFIFPPARENELAVVQQAYPGGQVIRRFQGGKLYFTVYQK